MLFGKRPQITERSFGTFSPTFYTFSDNTSIITDFNQP